jgi:hypothetical protein
MFEQLLSNKKQNTTVLHSAAQCIRQVSIPASKPGPNELQAEYRQLPSQAISLQGSIQAALVRTMHEIRTTQFGICLSMDTSLFGRLDLLPDLTWS